MRLASQLCCRCFEICEAVTQSCISTISVEGTELRRGRLSQRLVVKVLDAILFEKGRDVAGILLMSSSATGVTAGLAQLKVFALIPATIIFSLITTIGGVVIGLQWGAIALAVIANATILQSSYLVAGLLSEARSPRTVSRTNLRTELIRAAQVAIGEELRTHFQAPHDLPSSLRTKIEQLALRCG